MRSVFSFIGVVFVSACIGISLWVYTNPHTVDLLYYDMVGRICFQP